MDRAIYAKDLLQVPKNMNELIYMLQRGMNQAQFNQMFANQLAAQRNTLSQMQAQILAQLQGLEFSTSKEMVNVQLASQLQSSLKRFENSIKWNDKPRGYFYFTAEKWQRSSYKTYNEYDRSF